MGDARYVEYGKDKKMTTEITTDPVALSAMDAEHLAIQVTLRKGIINEIGIIRPLPAGSDTCYPLDYLTADRVLSLLDELDNAFDDVEWFKTSVGLNLRCYCNDNPYKAKVDTRMKVSRKVCIVLSWLDAFDKGLINAQDNR